MTNKEKVRRAYLADPTAYANEIAERTGLTKSQVRGARSSLTRTGELPHMYGFMGAMHQADPEPLNSALDAVMANYKVTPA